MHNCSVRKSEKRVLFWKFIADNLNVLKAKSTFKEALKQQKMGAIIVIGEEITRSIEKIHEIPNLKQFSTYKKKESSNVKV